MLKQTRFWTQIVAFFLIYVNKSTKSRGNLFNNRTEFIRDSRDYNRGVRSSVGCPLIPMCQWARYQELPIKMDQGSRSSVSMLVDNYNQEPVVKKIFTDKTDFMTEMKALSCIRIGHNPWLVNPVCADPMKMTMVLEWGGDGDLTKWNIFGDKFQPYSYDDVVEISAQMVAAVAATHRRGFVHGDLKPENFTINTQEKKIKLIDFGLSAKIGEYRIMAQGTPQTMSPEVAFDDFFDNQIYATDPKISTSSFKNEWPSNPAAASLNNTKLRPQFIQESMDWWSLGVSLHYIFAKYFDEHEEAFVDSSSSEDSDDQDNSIADEKYYKSDDQYFPYKVIFAENDEIIDFRYRPIPAAFTSELRSLLDKLMTWIPEKRNFKRKRLFEEICQHEFFRRINWDRIDPNLKAF